MLPLGLSMLWESTDARTAFRNRFGFVDYSAGVDWLSETVWDRWGLAVQDCERIMISDHNAIAWIATADTERPLICKWSRAKTQFAKLAATADLIIALAARGIPVAAPVLTRYGSGREIVAGPAGPSSLTVQPAVGGDLLDLDDEMAVREAGVQLARLHRAMADLSHSPATVTAWTP